MQRQRAKNHHSSQIFFSWLLTTGLLLQACGQQSGGPSPVNPGTGTNTANNPVHGAVNEICANQGGDTDGDGFCDQVEETDPIFSASCTENAATSSDCNKNGIRDDRDGDDSLWEKASDLERVLGVLAVGAGIWSAFACTLDRGKGCDYIPGGGKLFDGIDDPSFLSERLNIDPDQGQGLVNFQLEAHGPITSKTFVRKIILIHDSDSTRGKNIKYFKQDFGPSLSSCLHSRFTAENIVPASSSRGIVRADLKLESDFKDSVTNPKLKGTREDFKRICGDSEGAHVAFNFKKDEDGNVFQYNIEPLDPLAILFLATEKPFTRRKDVSLAFSALPASLPASGQIPEASAPKLYFFDANDPSLSSIDYAITTISQFTRVLYNDCPGPDNACRARVLLTLPEPTSEEMGTLDHSSVKDLLRFVQGKARFVAEFEEEDDEEDDGEI